MDYGFGYGGSGATGGCHGGYSVGLDTEDDDPTIAGSVAAQAHSAGVLPIWGNAATLNLNPLILTNIQVSPYYKSSLAGLRLHTEIIDEIYYKVDHLEPWERGSRKTSGQTGMCGGVRGVGAGGIVSSAYCLLFKLAAVKLTKKQLYSIINHCDSPYIRGIGFMYIRYSQPPQDLWSWFAPYLDDLEEIDVKAGGGKLVTIGGMVRSFMERLEWFDTRFPRIPVNVQKQLADNLGGRHNEHSHSALVDEPASAKDVSSHGESETTSRSSSNRDRPRSRSRSRGRKKDEDRSHRYRSSSRDRNDEKKRSHKKRKKHKEEDDNSSSSRRARYSRSRSTSPSRNRHHHKSKKKKSHRERSRSRSFERRRRRD